MTIEQIKEKIFEMKDDNRALFQGKCCRTKYQIVGNTIPYLRSLAKQIIKEKNYDEFLNSDSDIYEYVLLQGFVISYTNNIEAMKRFIYKIDDWSVCDTTHLKKQSPEYLKAIYEWVKADE